jgi:hypothetical protein
MNISIIRSHRWLIAATAIALLASGERGAAQGATQVPYVPVARAPFTNPISVPGVPTIFTTLDKNSGDSLSSWAKDAMESIKDCRRKDFDKDIATIKDYWLKNAQNQYDAQHDDTSLQDANNIASLINFIQNAAKWDKCKDPAPMTAGPPDPPKDNVYLGTVGFPVGKSEGATPPKPVPPPAPPQQQVQTTPSPPPSTSPPPPVPPMPPMIGSKFSVGPAIVSEFPSVKASVTGTISGSGSVDNDTARVSAGVALSWTSAPFNALPFPTTVGGSIFFGAPINSESTASARTTGGFTERLQTNNSWPVIAPQGFIGAAVTPSTKVGLGAGAWIENTKETVSLSIPGFTESDSHSGTLIRPFISGTIVQNVGDLTGGLLGSPNQEIKLTGGFIFPTAATFQADFCPGGFSCVRTREGGSFFVMGSFNWSFPQ